MPWKIIRGLGCPTERPFAVVKHDEQGRPIGERLGCHPTRESANRQLAALYASERQAKQDIQAAMLVIERRRAHR